ncbi:hypothetical protein PS2_011026 [Malus domestica]
MASRNGVVQRGAVKLNRPVNFRTCTSPSPSQTWPTGWRCTSPDAPPLPPPSETYPPSHTGPPSLLMPMMRKLGS